MRAKVETREVFDEDIMCLLMVTETQPVGHSCIEMPFMLLSLCHMCLHESCRKSQPLQYEQLQGLLLRLSFVLHYTSNNPQYIEHHSFLHLGVANVVAYRQGMPKSLLSQELIDVI